MGTTPDAPMNAINQSFSPTNGPPSGRERVHVRETLNLIWSEKWKIVGVMLLCLAVGVFYAVYLAKPVYRASAALIMQGPVGPEDSLQTVLGGFGAENIDVNSEIEVLRARALLGEVANNLKLHELAELNGALRTPTMIDRWRQAFPLSPVAAVQDQPEQTRDRVVTAMQNRLNIRAVPNSHVLSISFESHNATLAAQIANGIADTYLQRQINLKAAALQNAVDWLTTRADELRIQLEDAEQRRAEFMASIDLVSENSVRALERQLQDLRDREEQQTGQIIENQAWLNAIGRGVAPQEIAELTEDRVLLRLARDDPQGAEFTARLLQVVVQAETNIARAEAQIRELTNPQAELEGRIATQSGNLIRLQQLDREVESLRSLYETFLARSHEMSTQQGLQQADAAIISQAIVPLNPYAPRKSRIIIIALAGGLALGCGLVLFRELNRAGFRTPLEVESALGLPVLGQIPQISGRNRRAVVQHLLQTATSLACDSVRALRTSILLAQRGEASRVIMITSSIPGEGKTLTSVALADQMAALGRRVVVVEADLRRGSFVDFFPDAREFGLSAILTGECELDQAITRPPGLGFDVIKGGEIAFNPADGFNSNHFEKMIARLKARFDIILIDTPPILPVPDARIIAQQVDGIVFCVKYMATSQENAAQALHLLHQDGRHLMGLVLTQVSAKGFHKYEYGHKKRSALRRFTPSIFAR